VWFIWVVCLCVLRRGVFGWLSGRALYVYVIQGFVWVVCLCVLRGGVFGCIGSVKHEAVVPGSSETIKVHGIFEPFFVPPVSNRLFSLMASARSRSRSRSRSRLAALHVSDTAKQTMPLTMGGKEYDVMVGLACYRSSVIAKAVAFKVQAGQQLAFSDLGALDDDTGRALAKYFRGDSGYIRHLRPDDLEALISMYGLDRLRGEEDDKRKKDEEDSKWRTCVTCNYRFQRKHNTARSCPIPRRGPDGLCLLCGASMFHCKCETVWRAHADDE